MLESNLIVYQYMKNIGTLHNSISIKSVTSNQKMFFVMIGILKILKKNIYNIQPSLRFVIADIANLLSDSMKYLIGNLFNDQPG